MKLYLLRPKEPYGHEALEDDPWKPWYDKVFGFVVRAEDELRARQIADDNAGNENHTFDENGHYLERHLWLDEKYSACVELSSGGEEELIIRDFHAA